MLGLDPRLGAESRWRTLAGVAVIVGLVAILFDSAYERIFSAINIADDEGYAIVMMRSFADGSALYDDFFSPYGPGFYTLVGGAMKLLGVAFDNEGARWVNLFLWLASTGLAGVALLRLTRSVVIAGFGTLIAFFVLSADALEPLHPGATIGFLLLALVVVVVFLFPSRVPAAMAALGLLCVALASVKINIGALAGVSILFACALTSPWLRPVAVVRWGAIALFVLVPFALMRVDLGEDNTLRWALIVVAGAIALSLIAVWQGEGTRPLRRDLAWLLGGAAGMLLLVSLVPIALGTSPGGLIDGWLIRPTEHPVIAFIPLPIDELGPLWALLGLIGASATTIALAGKPAESPAWAAFGVARLLGGTLIWLSLATPVLGLSAGFTQAIVIASPLVWLAAVSPPGEGRELRFVRVLLPALALLQTLHAYPVPGAQLAWAELLFVIVGGISLRDGIADLAAPARERFGGHGHRVAVGATIAVAAFGTWFALGRVKPFTDDADATYAAAVPLDLQGSGRMRANPDLVAQFQDLAGGIERHCDSLITLPGMNSLNLYSGVGSPEELASPWMLFLTSEEQQEIVDRAITQPRLCAVRKPDLLQFWAGFTHGEGIPADRPLIRFIRDDFRVIHNYDGYYLAVRRGA
ncbi:MAG: hypothetical protein ABWZ18_04040 [Solirubrobacterales bacterium]